jgi:hypothetical protein
MKNILTDLLLQVCNTYMLDGQSPSIYDIFSLFCEGKQTFTSIVKAVRHTYVLSITTKRNILQQLYRIHPYTVSIQLPYILHPQ